MLMQMQPILRILLVQLLDISNAFCLQWGQQQGDGTANQKYYFPVAFTETYKITLNHVNSAGSGYVNSISSVASSYFILQGTRNSVWGICFHATGKLT